jgi:hypothetical protein
MDEVLKTLEEETFVRGKDMMKALIPAAQSLQISVKFGIKLLAQTAALYWSVEHMFCNFDVGIYSLMNLRLSISPLFLSFVRVNILRSLLLFAEHF